MDNTRGTVPREWFTEQSWVHTWSTYWKEWKSMFLLLQVLKIAREIKNFERLNVIGSNSMSRSYRMKLM